MKRAVRLTIALAFVVLCLIWGSWLAVIQKRLRPDDAFRTRRVPPVRFAV